MIIKFLEIIVFKQAKKVLKLATKSEPLNPGEDREVERMREAERQRFFHPEEAKKVDAALRQPLPPTSSTVIKDGACDPSRPCISQGR